MELKILFVSGNDKLRLLDGLQEDYPGQQIHTCRRNDRALALARRENPQLIIIDLDLAESQQPEFLREIRRISRSARILAVLNTAPLSTAVRAVKAGVDELIHLGEEPQRFRKELERFFRDHQELRKGEDLHHRQRQKFDFSNIIGSSPEIQQVFAILTKVIRRPWVTVLVRGETGTGKELIARAIHYNCFSQFQPFVAVNCNALPESLLESELFGHEKGAFTDAKTRKRGLFELAQNGTLFLDEIGDISLKMQVKLLKALEEKKIRRVGGTEDIQVDCRIIAATNRDLQEGIRQGTFRNDLFYRLNVISVNLPPLRERGTDIILLGRHFLQKFVGEYESPIKGFDPEAEALMMSYPWPGNVRELRHTVERIVLLGEKEEVDRAALEDAIESEIPLVLAERPAPAPIRLEVPAEGFTLDKAEKFLIAAILDQTKWNKRRASNILKISRPRLDRKIEKYSLQPPAVKD